VSELVCAELQATLNRAVTQYSSLEQALVSAVASPHCTYSDLPLVQARAGLNLHAS
jgi:hypothetical protein